MPNSIFLDDSSTFTGPILLPDGSASAPSLARAANRATGWYFNSSNSGLFSSNGTQVSDQGITGGDPYFQIFGTGARLYFSGDTIWQRTAAGSLSITDNANGKTLNFPQVLTELTTIAAAATTDTTIQMPANAVVLGVSVRVTTVIPDATSFSVGDSGSATRFSTANVSTAANSTDPGTKAGAYYNASALSVRLTMNGGTPATNTGRVRVTIYYYSITPPTS